MKKVSAAPRNHAVRVPGRGRRSGIRHNPPLPSRGMTKSRNYGPCSTSCSAACKRTRVCCVSFPVVIRLWPFETAATSARCCPAGCTGCRKRRGKGLGWRSLMSTASRTSMIRSATPPGIWFCGSSQSSRGRSSPTQRRSHGLGETGFVLLLPDADEDALFRRLEAIREACTERLLVHADRDVRFSISVGGYRFTLSAL